MSNHHIVHFKYLTILFVIYTSIKLKTEQKYIFIKILRLGGHILIAADVDDPEEEQHCLQVFGIAFFHFICQEPLCSIPCLFSYIIV